jgi:hypothetical protein
MAALLIGGAPTSTVRALTAPDPSDVVLVLDFSASILDEPPDRNRFGAALERIADRVEATSSVPGCRKQRCSSPATSSLSDRFTQTQRTVSLASSRMVAVASCSAATRRSDHAPTTIEIGTFGDQSGHKMLASDGTRLTTHDDFDGCA